MDYKTAYAAADFLGISWTEVDRLIGLASQGNQSALDQLETILVHAEALRKLVPGNNKKDGK